MRVPTLFGDIPPPPTALHRIGFEIFRKRPASTNVVDEKGVDVGVAQIVLTREEEREFAEIVKDERERFDFEKQISKAVGDVFDKKWEDIERDLRRTFFKKCRYKRVKDVYGSNAEPLPDGAWKFPLEMSAEERKRIVSQMAAVKDEFRICLEAEYVKSCGTGGLKRVGRYARRDIPYMYVRYVRETAEWNALEIVKRVLADNETMRTRLEGVPIELLTKKHSYSVSQFTIMRSMLRDMIVRWMPDALNDIERQIVFEWMYADWKERKSEIGVLKCSNRDLREDSLAVGIKDSPFHAKDLSIDTKKVLSPSEDCPVDTCLASDFVKKWAARAKSLGRTFQDYETSLVSKATTRGGSFANRGSIYFENPSELVYCGLNIDKSGSDSPLKIAFKGSVEACDIGIAAKYCRHLKNENGWRTDLAELRLDSGDSNTVSYVTNTFKQWLISRWQPQPAKSMECQRTGPK